MHASPVDAKAIRPTFLAGTTHHSEGAFQVPPSHAAFLTRVTSTKNKDGVRRLALQEVARQLEEKVGEEVFIPEVSVDEEKRAWSWTLHQTKLFANTRADVVRANRIAVKRLAEELRRRVYQLRNARTLAALRAPHAESHQERRNREQAAARAKKQAQLRPGPKPMVQRRRLPSRMSPQQSAGAWLGALQKALETRG